MTFPFSANDRSFIIPRTRDPHRLLTSLANTPYTDCQQRSVGGHLVGQGTLLAQELLHLFRPVERDIYIRSSVHFQGE